MTRARRDGLSVLLVVCALAFAVGLVSLATHTLWRGSSRSLFGVQEHRELVNLCHSAIAEALFDLQAKLEQGASDRVDWCTDGRPPDDIPFEPRTTKKFLSGMLGEGSALTYSVGTVAVKRVQGLSKGAGMAGRLGVIDFEVRVEVSRERPTQHARVKMTQRRAFWFSDGVTAFSRSGRHVEILRQPLATFLEFP